MPSVISAGASDDSAANVANPTVLTPTNPTTRTNGDWLWCFTSSTSATATVGLSSGWATVWDRTITNMHMAAFSCKVTGSETAPTVTWTGLTTGSSGTPCIAIVLNLGTGWAESAGALVIDALGPISTYTANALVHAGGGAFYTLTADTWVFSMGLRLDDTVGGVVVDTGGAPVIWSVFTALASASGADMYQIMSHGLGPSGVGGLVQEHTWATNGTAVDSNGFMVAMALEPAPGEAGPLTYTRGQAPA